MIVAPPRGLASVVSHRSRLLRAPSTMAILLLLRLTSRIRTFRQVTGPSVWVMDVLLPRPLLLVRLLVSTMRRLCQVRRGKATIGSRSVQTVRAGKGAFSGTQ